MLSTFGLKHYFNLKVFGSGYLPDISWHLLIYLYPRTKVRDTMHLSSLCRCCHRDFLCALYSLQVSSVLFQIQVTCLLHQVPDAN